MNKVTMIIVIIIFTIFSGCSYTVPKYKPSSDLAMNLQDNFLKTNKKINIISVKNFSVNDRYCRNFIPIYARGNEPFGEYIKNAFTTELKRAELYSDEASSGIKIQIHQMSFKSLVGFGDYVGFGIWYYNVKVYSDNNEFYVDSTHKFSTDWGFKEACPQVAYAFKGSVEQLLKDITNHKQFQNFFK